MFHHSLRSQYSSRFPYLNKTLPLLQNGNFFEELINRKGPLKIKQGAAGTLCQILNLKKYISFETTRLMLLQSPSENGIQMINVFVADCVACSCPDPGEPRWVSSSSEVQT